MRRAVCLLLIIHVGGNFGSTFLAATAKHLGCYQIDLDYTSNSDMVEGSALTPFSRCFSSCRERGAEAAGLAIVRTSTRPRCRFRIERMISPSPRPRRLPSFKISCYCMSHSESLDQWYSLADDECGPCLRTNYTCGISQDGIYSFYKVIEDPVPEVDWKVEDVDILLGTKHGVALLNSSNKNYQTLAEFKVHDHVQVVDFHYRRAEIFALVYGDIYRLNLTNNMQKDESYENFRLLRNNFMSYAMAVDWVHSRVFWAQDFHDAGIHMVDLDGSNYDVLVAVSEHFDKILQLHDLAVDPYKGLLFWTTDEPSLMSCQLDGTGLRRLITAEDIMPLVTLHHIALDLPNEKIYFSSTLNGTSWVNVSDYEGHFHPVHIPVEDGMLIHDISVFQSQMYYITAPHDYLNMNHSANIYKASIEGNLTEGVKLVHSNESIIRLKVFHPEMQTPGRTDQCTDHGCSHHCVIVGDNATCRCPAYYILAEDEKNCHMIEAHPLEDGLVFELTQGVCSVVFLLLSAGVLMCLCDKLWSHIHPTYNKLLRRPVIYNGGDAENLLM